jgi:hypothetical protein
MQQKRGFRAREFLNRYELWHHLQVLDEKLHFAMACLPVGGAQDHGWVDGSEYL